MISVLPVVDRFVAVNFVVLFLLERVETLNFRDDVAETSGDVVREV